MCGSATLAIVVSTPCMIVAQVIDAVMAPRLSLRPRPALSVVTSAGIPSHLFAGLDCPEMSGWRKTRDDAASCVEPVGSA
jgi:hypothetical protein